jgi:hypothetical protein
MADDVERVLADVDADHGDLGACCLGHGRAPVDAAPVQRQPLAGQEHGRTIPLPDISGHLLLRCTSAFFARQRFNMWPGPLEGNREATEFFTLLGGVAGGGARSSRCRYRLGSAVGCRSQSAGIPNVDPGRRLFRNACRAGREQFASNGVPGPSSSHLRAHDVPKIISAQPKS